MQRASREYIARDTRLNTRSTYLLTFTLGACTSSERFGPLTVKQHLVRSAKCPLMPLDLPVVRVIGLGFGFGFGFGFRFGFGFGFGFC